MGYRVQSIDTSPEVEKLQIEILRKKGEAGRSQLMRSLTGTTRWLSWNNLCQTQSRFDPLATFYNFVKLSYGNELAAEIQKYFEECNFDKTALKEKLMLSNDILDAIIPVIDVLDELKIAYLIAGSVASSTHGIARSTADADLVADIRAEHVSVFIARLQSEYYVSEIAIQEALNRHSSFNLLHLGTGIKVDIFVLKTDPFNQTSFTRAREAQLDKANPRLFRVDAPEDVLLQKLNWYRVAGGVSEKQWLDVLGILKTQTDKLDRNYLADWATKLGLSNLLEKAFDEAGLTL